jgi:hypothetical protein
LSGSAGPAPGGGPPDTGLAGSPLKVFINYRHEDTQGTAWALYLKLAERFGAENVFFDNGTLRPGMRWLEEITSRLAGGGAFIALIGPNWLPSLTTHLQRGGEDYVAREIDLALRSGPGVTVIPVLVDDARLPEPRDLPPALSMLPGCQQERLRHTHLPYDIDHLIARLGEARDEPDRVPVAAGRPQRRPPGPGRVAPRPDEDHYRMVAGHAGNLVVFLGAGANADDYDQPWSPGSGLPDDRDLAKYLASHFGLADAPLHLAEVAQYAGAIYGEMELFEWVTQALRVDSEPTPVHRYLARLPARLGNRCQMIVTPKYDAVLEKAFREANEEFDVAVYMAPGTEQAGTFVHLPWGELPRPIDKPNEYAGFPIVAEDRRLRRTVIVRINGTVDDPAAGFPWEDNYVITEDHYIDYLNGRSAEEAVPGQLLAKLRKANYLFLGYTIADWRLRVFLQRVWKGTRLGRAKYWAVEQEPDVLERDLWQQAGVSLYQSSLTDYLKGLFDFLDDHPGEAQP